MITNILATIWPASMDLLKEVQAKWANRFRLNMSHWSVDFHKNAIQKIKELSSDWDFWNEVVLDTKWPDIRTWDIDWEVKILKWEKYFFEFLDFKEKILDAEKKFWEDKKIFHWYKKFFKTVKKWDTIIVDDWKIVFIVEDFLDNSENFSVVAKNSWEITSRRHINVPWKFIDLPILTESDKAILKMWIENWIDSVAVSFVRNKKDISDVREFVWENIKIISKIENVEWVQNIDEIIEFSDEIMVARWDLWVEINFYKLPLIQKHIVKKCNRSLKPVIVATQMLMSMTENQTPTRAEVFDVYSAVEMWAETVMLSDETASWKHPVKAVWVMKKICEFAENTDGFDFDFK